MALNQPLTRALTRQLNRSIIRAAAGDADFASVVLLLDFAGADGVTNITDLSDSGHVDTFVADAQVDTAITCLDGQNTLLLDGTLDYIHFPDSTDWDFGTADFTVEFTLQTAADGVTAGLISTFDDPDGWSIQQISGGNLRLLHGSSELKSEVWDPTEGVEYHVAVCRDGSNLRMFIDGVELGTTTTDSTNLAGSTATLAIGALPVPAQYVNGSIGAVRITKGVARYKANFTPPTEFYPTS